MSETVINSELPSTSSELNPSSRIVCHVCQKQFSHYTCPRCNVRYCALQCYKSHSRRCTESFMRENVMEELKQLRSDHADKRKMLDILERFHSEEEIDSMDQDDADLSLSEEIVQKILSGSQISLDDLSSVERKYFQRAMASGDLSRLIKPWEPWWFKPSAKNICLSRLGTQLIQPFAQQEAFASAEDDTEYGQLQDIPPGPEAPLSSVNKLIAAEPSPLLVVHLVDIIYSYCFTLRHYNGDWQSDSVGSAMELLSISLVLGQGSQPNTVFKALSDCLAQICSAAFRHIGGLKFGLELMDDVITLLHLGGAAIVCLLCDLERLLQAAKRELKMEKSRKLKNKEIKIKLESVGRKVYFMMCWVHEQPGDVWSSLAATVAAEKAQTKKFGGTERSTLKTIEDKAKRQGKPLIKELQ